jgi:hypothetical protein
MTLTEIIAEMEKAGRVPKPLLEAHQKTLEALVALAERIEALERKPRK